MPLVASSFRAIVSATLSHSIRLKVKRSSKSNDTPSTTLLLVYQTNTMTTTTSEEPDNGTPAASATTSSEPPLVTDAEEPETKEEQATGEEDEKDEEGTKNSSTPPPANDDKGTLESSTFEDDGTFALPPGKEFKTTSATPAESNNNKGAQILMSRFSTWRQKANENATVLWKQAKEAQATAAANNQGPLAALRQVSSVAVGNATENGTTTSSGNSNDDQKMPAEEADNSTGGGFINMEENTNDNTTTRNSTNDDNNDEEDPEEKHHNDEEEAETSHSTPRTIPNLPTRRELRSRAQAVASGVAESLDSYYATGFRGRYAGNNNDPTNKPATPSASSHEAAKESQTSLILKSRAAGHLQEILASLEPFQYVLLLGAGRLQVNLKNPYVKHQGTYVDFLVSGGAADKSGVVAVGDSIVKVGPQDVRKHTIADVPSIIAHAKRPVVLVLTTGVEMDVDRITYLDLAVAMMHRMRAKDMKQKREMIASAHKNQEPKEEPQESAPNADDTSSPNTEEEEGDDNPTTTQPDVEEPKEEEFEEHDEQVYDDIKIPVVRTAEGYTSPPLPPLAASKAYKHLVGKRCNDNFSVTEFSQFAASDDNLRETLRNAFLCCAVDGRRFPFLGRHLTMEQDMLDNNTYKASNSQRLQQPNKNSPNALLMLFLELLNFADLHGVTPACRRKEVAQRIACKFFLPTKVNDVGSGQPRLEPPMFDFHHIVSDSVLRKLEADLAKADSDGVSRDLFLEFQHAVVDALCGTTFLLFLVSNHCARMRGYLRNVAPYVNVSLNSVMEALITKPSPDASAKHCFLFTLIYLIQLEKDPTSTLSTDDSTLLGRNGRRMVGAAGGLCCYLFILRNVVPALERFQEKNVAGTETKPTEGGAESNNTKATISEGDGEAIVKAIGQFWEIFIVPGVGALEHCWKSKESKEYLESLRGRLRSIRKEVLGSSGGETDKECRARFAQKFASEPGLLKNLKDLADHLLYDYAIHTHSQFREHHFHEMLCNEIVKGKREQSKLLTPDRSGEVEESTKPLPELPSGCIKRLLRKIDLPVGVSPHRPLNLSAAKKPAPTETKATAQSLNADCAVVFGTSVGSDLAVKMMSPAMDRQSDIRRYTCQDVTVGGPKLPESFEDEMIPPTLESYAVLPSTRLSGFSEVTGNVSISADGWEISLINFMIPKADDGSEPEESHSLYGVSLVFQQSPNARYYPRKISLTQLLDKADEGKTKASADGGSSPEPATIDDDGKFPSPITFDIPSDNHWLTFNRNVKVSAKVPVFNSHIRDKRWIDRVHQDEDRDHTASATVGVALVSRRNTVIAMRQTLWMLLRDFSRAPEAQGGSQKNVLACGALVDLLGNFAHQDVEGIALKSILEPYIRASSAPWIERPLSAQKEEFERHAGQQLITCLPPIPLALLFIAALMEQKIILSSSRRSILFSATAALQSMLTPLKWCHLLVPLVPTALAKDLVQYPAPFILGMPSEDPSTMEIMNDLPMDVTLVDLDVGRVILAPEFSFDTTNLAPSDKDDKDPGAIMKELRAQVLYLAQILGSHFGAKLFRDAWSCDSPALTLRRDLQVPKQEADFDVLRSVCRSFIDELMAGISSSCFWIEEEAVGDKKCSEPTILFDEDRFFHIKRWREEHGYEPLFKHSDHDVNRNLALSMDGFNLVLETFVRCQSMNLFLSSQSKEGMAFSL
ncbi:DENN [Seminavis robusta]|uniref:DENN n=1 Tax=Seminavis robusta TaxID=568900 RepID=A0A9N8HKT6_9STRA|nr:DENN [Seminavis robusta]|eukprot:Sro759_g198140.1 DENN (1684) ;mRNA; f:871-6179